MIGGKTDYTATGIQTQASFRVNGNKIHKALNPSAIHFITKEGNNINYFSGYIKCSTCVEGAYNIS